MVGSTDTHQHLNTQPVRNFFREIDEIIIDFWKKNNIFQKSIESRPTNNQFVFFDGPPFPTGTPHYGHLLVSSIKDMVARYQTMLGKRVERQWGWDCHGIYVEQKVEKELGIKNRSEIGSKISEEEFVQACYNYVNNVSGKWPWYIDHIGRWADLDHAYWTLNKDYMESVIWVFKQIYDKGDVYKGKKVLMHCPRCVTPISKFEITMANSYKDLTDPSITVKFELIGKFKGYNNVYLLVWTTTPWTLPENVAVAVDQEELYVTVLFKGDYYIIAKKRLEQVFADKEYDVVDEYKGEELVGLSYEPLFDYFLDEATDKDFRIYPADFVTMEEGTGLVHMAPAYGEDDYNLSQKYGFSVFEGLSETGEFYDFIKEFAGKFFRDANVDVIKALRNKGLLFKEQNITHSYPVCPRCDTPLMYRATDSYFINLQKNKKKLLEQAEKINWIPEHLKHGRFRYILESAPDWNISRTRYWSVPIPIWKCDKCGNEIAVGSIKEIEERSGKKVTDLHRPYIDKHVFKCDKCDGEMHRVADVLDVWFESGNMPYASRHYPFENKDDFKKHFPADFIVEGIDQTRGWFNALHKNAVLLMGEPAFKNVLCHGVILGEDGAKMSKSRKNYPDPEPTIQKYGGDALRLYLLSSAVVEGDSVPMSEKDLAGVLRDVLIPYLNIYRYFAIYANQFDFKPAEHIAFNKDQFDKLHILDKWIFYFVHSKLNEIKVNLDTFHVMNAARQLRHIVDNISMWYIKRSRDRFVKGDKNALSTLFWVLWDINRAFAPFVPFVTEYVHQELKRVYGKALESVHLEYYPKILPDTRINKDLLENVSILRKIASLIHKVRVENNLPVKQPLSNAVVLATNYKSYEEWFADLLDSLKAEVNIDNIQIVTDRKDFNKILKVNKQNYKITEEAGLVVAVNVNLTDDLIARRIVREFIRQLQVMRKHLKLELAQTADVNVYVADNDVYKILNNSVPEIKQQGKLNALVINEVSKQELQGYLDELGNHNADIAGNSLMSAVKVGHEKVDIYVIMRK